MSVRAHLPEATTFEPTAITAMSRAFEDVCSTLHVFAGDTRGREIIATRIIDLARRGIVDADTLRDRVLFESHSAA